MKRTSRYCPNCSPLRSAIFTPLSCFCLTRDFLQACIACSRPSLLLPQGTQLTQNLWLGELIVPDQLDMLPQDRRQMRPGIFWYCALATGEFRSGCCQVARIPDDDGVDDQTQRCGSIQLRLVFTLGKTALLPKEDAPRQRM